MRNTELLLSKKLFAEQEIPPIANVLLCVVYFSVFLTLSFLTVVTLFLVKIASKYSLMLSKLIFEPFSSNEIVLLLIPVNLESSSCLTPRSILSRFKISGIISIMDKSLSRS